MFYPPYIPNATQLDNMFYPPMSQKHQRKMQMAKCALAVGVMAANLGYIPLTENVNLTYSIPPDQNVITSSPGKIIIYSYSKYKRNGTTRVIIKCLKTQCIDVNARRVMDNREAMSLIKIYSVTHREKRSRDSGYTLRTVQLKSNMFYDWLKYSVQQVRKPV